MRLVVDCQPARPERYRYHLRVQVGDGPALTVIQKNPSLADSARRDPTVGKVEAWARRRGYGLVTYVNLFACRSPHPVTLNRFSYEEAVGPQNDAAVQAALQQQSLLIAAWGNPNGIDSLRYIQRIAEVLALLRDNTDRQLYVVGGWTKAGHPRHGLHWNGAAALLEWGIGSREHGTVPIPYSPKLSSTGS